MNLVRDAGGEFTQLGKLLLLRVLDLFRQIANRFHDQGLASILDLGLHWQPDDHVVIVDAMAPGTAPGRVVTFDATFEPLTTPGAVSTHEIDVSVAVELARAIGRIDTGEGESFEDSPREASTTERNTIS